MKIIIFLSIALLQISTLSAQPKTKYRSSIDNDVLKATGSILQMPYNRLIQSAGKVITYGNPELENHTLDLTVLPDHQNIAIEDRYGIAILNAKTQQIKTKWSFTDNSAYSDLMSTYSGITSFNYNNTSYIIWSAQGRGNDRGVVMIAQWNGDTIKNVSTIQFKAVAPATIALPNQVNVQFEEGIPYLYVVLNGNNQLVKMNFTNNKILWTANTGVAPFGITIVKNKAYVTNWAGPLVTDNTQENAGTPWGSAYTNPVTGATKQGTVSVIDINSGKVINELPVGLHPNAIIKSSDDHFIYLANANSDYVSVIDAGKDQVIDSIDVGLFANQNSYFGSSPNGLHIDSSGTMLYVANGLDNAIAIVKLGSSVASKGTGKTEIAGYIPTEAYPSGIALLNNNLYITNLEAKGARVLSAATEFKQPDGSFLNAFTIHKELASFSIVPLPTPGRLKSYTQKVKELNLFYRVALTNEPARTNISPKPVPERIGEPS
ncbi:MAG: phosphoesterase, partial [Segetibacter sp.]|nr:phosphoesterase [Segetibacter sp.]